MNKNTRQNQSTQDSKQIIAEQIESMELLFDQLESVAMTLQKYDSLKYVSDDLKEMFTRIRLIHNCLRIELQTMKLKAIKSDINKKEIDNITGGSIRDKDGFPINTVYVEVDPEKFFNLFDDDEPTEEDYDFSGEVACQCDECECGCECEEDEIPWDDDDYSPWDDEEDEEELTKEETEQIKDYYDPNTNFQESDELGAEDKTEEKDKTKVEDKTEEKDETGEKDKTPVKDDLLDAVVDFLEGFAMTALLDLLEEPSTDKKAKDRSQSKKENRRSTVRRKRR